MTGWVRSCAAGDCIEVRRWRHLIEARNQDGDVLPFTQAEWDAFVAGVKNGDFDHLTGDTP